MRSQNLIDVTGNCYSIASPRAKILEDNWTKFHVESDATPYHAAWTTPSIPFHFARYQNKTFQQDNARAHTARATRDFLQQNNVNVMNWPALSPDLNPIVHLWDEIQRRLNEEQPSPTNAAELSVVFQRVWALIPMAFINRLDNF
jgi:hypothetical protein